MRFVAPADRTDVVRGLLLAEPGATHVTALPGAAVQPVGDVVEAVVARDFSLIAALPAGAAGMLALTSVGSASLAGIVVVAAVVLVLARSRSERGWRRLAAG